MDLPTKIDQCKTTESLNALRLESVKDETFWKNQKLFTKQVYRILHRNKNKRGIDDD